MNQKLKIQKVNKVTCLVGQFEWLEANLVLVTRTWNWDRMLDIERDRRIMSPNVEIFKPKGKIIVSLVW